MSRPGKCRGCNRAIPPDNEREWLTRGTGICAVCARARVAQAEKTNPGKAYVVAWNLALDTHRRIAVGLRAR